MTLEQRIARIEQVLGLRNEDGSEEALYRHCIREMSRGNRKPLDAYLKSGRKVYVVNSPVNRGHAESPAPAGKPTAVRLRRASRG